MKFLIFNAFFLAIIYSIKSPEERTTRLRPQDIIEKFVQISGGKEWTNLKTRKEYSYVQMEEDKSAIIPINSYNRTTVFSDQGNSLELHDYGDHQTMLIYKPKCNWYYSSNSQTVKFFGPEPIHFNSTFPRNELLEVLK